MATEIHIGHLIGLKLKEKRLTKKLLGGMTGIKPVTVRYLLKRETLDVVTLHKIGKALKFNFFNYYPIEESEKQILNIKNENGNEGEKKFLEKIAELEKQLDVCKRDLTMQKQENGYLKEINELLKKK